MLFEQRNPFEGRGSESDPAFEATSPRGHKGRKSLPNNDPLLTDRSAGPSAWLPGTYAAETVCPNHSKWTAAFNLSAWRRREVDYRPHRG